VSFKACLSGKTTPCPLRAVEKFLQRFRGVAQVADWESDGVRFTVDIAADARAAKSSCVATGSRGVVADLCFRLGREAHGLRQKEDACLRMPAPLATSRGPQRSSDCMCGLLQRMAGRPGRVPLFGGGPGRTLVQECPNPQDGMAGDPSRKEGHRVSRALVHGGQRWRGYVTSAQSLPGFSR